MANPINPVPSSYCRELINATAVKMEAVARSGGDNSMYGVQLKTAVTICALIEDLSSNDVSRLIENAHSRARRIFSNGEDWRRELKLYQTLCNFITN